MKKIRFGVVGTNFITDWVIAGGLEDERFELSAVYSRNQQSADAFAQKHKIAHTFVSLEDMAKSNLIDAVYIASPNALHAQQSILCMMHGKHVLCEKPLASNAKEAKAMIEVAKKQGVVLMEAMKPTLTLGFKAVQQNLHRIGTIRRYFSSYCQYSSRYDKLKEGIVLNAFDPSLSNGAIMDIGIYTIYPMVVLFGRPQKISATGIKLFTGADAQGAINFDYNEMNATVLYSKIADSKLPTEIQGEDGIIQLDKINQITDVSLHLRNGHSELLISKDTPRKNEYYYEVAAFVDAILSAKQPEINSLENSLITIKIIDEIRQQLKVSFPADEV